MAWRTFGSGRSSSSVVFTVEELDSTEKQFLSDAAEKEDATTPTKFDVDMGGQVSGSKSTTRQVGCFRKVTYRTEGLTHSLLKSDLHFDLSHHFDHNLGGQKFKKAITHSFLKLGP